MKKTAVIGANGFLGKELVKKFLILNHQVFGVFNKNRENIDNTFKSLTQQRFIQLKPELDNIIFCAGSFKNNREQLLEINQFLFWIVTNYKNVRLVYMSSANVYGNSNIILTEESPFFNPSPYGRAKLNGEFMVMSMNNFAIIRPVYLYGPELNNKTFLPFIISQAKEKNEITLIDRGQRKQDYLYIEDAIDLIIKALYSSENDIFLGATGKSISNLKVAKEICKLLPSTISYLDKPEKATSFYYDPIFTCKKLDWFPRYSFSDGIKKCI